MFWARCAEACTDMRGCGAPMGLVNALAKGLGWVVLTSTTSLLVAEVVVKEVAPVPRTQVIRSAEQPEIELVTVSDEVVWRSTNAQLRSLYHRPCRERVGDEGHVVAMVGDSILYLSSSERASDNVASKLEDQLGGEDAGWCVVNAAMSGYSAQQKLATALDILERERPDVLFWEVWGEGPTYRKIGTTMYAVGSYAQDADGVPYVRSWPVPAVINSWLFRHSRFWEYAVLAMGAHAAEDDVLPYHRRIIDETRAAGTQLVFGVFPDLQGPLSEGPRTKHAIHPPLRALAAEEGVPVVEVAELLGDVDVERVRLDPCCHYNAEGHALLGEVLAPVLREAVVSDAPTKDVETP